MARSALSGVFREFVVSFQTSTGEWEQDEYGNPVPVTTSGEMVINFEATSAPQIVFQPGADAQVVRGTGTCINPVALPTGIGIGSELGMTYDGEPGTLRILQVDLDPLEVLDEVLGTTFRSEWRPTGGA